MREIDRWRKRDSKDATCEVNLTINLDNIG